LGIGETFGHLAFDSFYLRLTLSSSESLEEDSEYLIANSSESLTGDSDGELKHIYHLAYNKSR